MDFTNKLKISPLISLILIKVLIISCGIGTPISVNADGETILPLGDSITQANASQNSYRRALWIKLEDAGYEVDFVGSLDRNYPSVLPPNPDFDRDHEGHWGWRADELLSDLPGWLTSYTPDYVLLHAGTNDIFQKQSVSSTVEDLKSIIDTLRDANPNVIILIAQLIPTTPNSFNNDQINLLNAEIPNIISLKHTTQSPVILVDQNTGFDTLTDTYDNVHPNDQGEEKMAQKWFDALVNLLPGPIESVPIIYQIVLIFITILLLALGLIALRNKLFITPQ